jgi:SAM-dependent methyltransferase
MNSGYSEDWYRDKAQAYAEYSLSADRELFLSRVLDRLAELAPGRRGLDAGCGAGAHHVAEFTDRGFEVWGVDSVAENVAVAHEWYPKLAARVRVHDLREPLPFEDASFDFAMCNAVIQHIDPAAVFGVVLPELARVLKRPGLLQLIFKTGNGLLTVYDPAFATDRTYQLYDEREVVSHLQADGLELVLEASGDGMRRFKDLKGVETSLAWFRKG